MLTVVICRLPVGASHPGDEDYLAPESAVVGCEYSADPAKDYSYLRCTVDSIPDIDVETLASQTWCFNVCGASHDSMGWLLSMLPCGTKSWGTAEDTMQMVGTLLWRLTSCNNGVAPLSTAYDMASTHELLDRALLGLLSQSEMQPYDFFQHCKVHLLKLPLCRYGCLHLVSVGSDAPSRQAFFGGKDYPSQTFSNTAPVHPCSTGRFATSLSAAPRTFFEQVGLARRSSNLFENDVWTELCVFRPLMH